jgi:hypothetical protein
MLVDMKLSIHRLVLCLLLLVAIPLQGYASLAMVACESSRMEHSIGHDSQSQMQGSTHQPGSMQHTADTHHAQPDDSFGESAAQHSCCSACVLGALDGSMVFSQPMGNPTQFNYSSATHVPPTLAGLERPPRRHLG